MNPIVKSLKFMILLSMCFGLTSAWAGKKRGNNCEDILEIGSDGYRRGDLRIDPDYRIFWKNKEVDLYAKPNDRGDSPRAAILFTILQSTRPLTIDDLSMVGWNREYESKKDSNRVRKAIERLRAAFLKVDGKFTCLSSLPGTGEYAWICDEETWIELGDLRYTANHQMQWQGKSITLSARDKRIVIALAKNGSNVTNFESIVYAFEGSMGAVESWTNLSMTIRQHIFHIRKEFRQVDDSFSGFEAVRGQGYIWLTQPK